MMVVNSGVEDGGKLRCGGWRLLDAHIHSYYFIRMWTLRSQVSIDKVSTSVCIV